MAVRGIRILHAGGPADDRTRDRRVRSGLVSSGRAGTRPILTIAPILADILPAELLRPHARPPRALAAGVRRAVIVRPLLPVEPSLGVLLAHADHVRGTGAAGHGLRGRSRAIRIRDVHRTLVPVVGRIPGRVRGDADLVAGLVSGLRPGDTTILVMMRANEPAVADVDLRVAGTPHDVAGLQVGHLGPIMPFKPGLLQGRALTGRVERGRADIQSGALQRVIDERRTIVVRVAGTTRLTVAVGIVRGDVLGPFDP